MNPIEVAIRQEKRNRLYRALDALNKELASIDGAPAVLVANYETCLEELKAVDDGLV